jgi:glycosyltransferase involved in cell wall biosynthesis
MYKGMKIAVVVPAHNEERLIARTVATMPEIIDHIIVVDDASSDDTAENAKAVGDRRLQVITLVENQGVGGAIITGHEQAMIIGADVSVVMAGDAQMDPAFLPQLIDPIAAGKAEFTKGNRFYGKGSFAGMPHYRVFGNIALSFLTKAASGYWNLFDPQNGYTAISRSALERLPLAHISRRYEFENDMLINLNILRVPAVDVPIPAVYGDEVSGINLRTAGPRILRQLFLGFWSRIWWKYVLQSFSAVALMLFGGLALLGVGLTAGAWIIANTLGPATASAGTVLLSVAPLLSGLHMLLFAMMLDIQEANPK